MGSSLALPYRKGQPVKGSPRTASPVTIVEAWLPGSPFASLRSAEDDEAQERASSPPDGRRGGRGAARDGEGTGAKLDDGGVAAP